MAVFNNACLPQAKGPLSLCHFHLLFPSSVTGCRGLGAVSTCQRTWSPHGSQSPSFCPGQSSLMPAHMPTGRGGHSKLGSPVLPFSAEYPRRGERTGGSHSRLASVHLQSPTPGVWSLLTRRCFSTRPTLEPDQEHSPSLGTTPPPSVPTLLSSARVSRTPYSPP